MRRSITGHAAALKSRHRAAFFLSACLQMSACAATLKLLTNGTPTMSPKELKAMLLLMDHSRGLYGSELVALSDGVLGRGTIYTLLDRLIEKGFVREVEEPPTPTLQMARTRHLITALGQKAVTDYLSAMNLQRVGGMGGLQHG